MGKYGSKRFFRRARFGSDHANGGRSRYLAFFGQQGFLTEATDVISGFPARNTLFWGK